MEEKKFKLDEEWRDMPKGVKTFGALLNEINDQLKERGRVLLGVLHGEISVTREETEAWEKRPVGEFDALEFLSAEPRELALHTSKEMVDFMEKLGQLGIRAADDFEAGEEAKAVSAFSECLEGWGMALQACWNLATLGDIDPSAIEIDGRILSSIASELRELFVKAVGDYGRGDMEAVNESLSRELALYIDPMREAFEHFQEKIEEKAAA